MFAGSTPHADLRRHIVKTRLRVAQRCIWLLPVDFRTWVRRRDGYVSCAFVVPPPRLIFRFQGTWLAVTGERTLRRLKTKIARRQARLRPLTAGCLLLSIRCRDSAGPHRRERPVLNTRTPLAMLAVGIAEPLAYCVEVPVATKTAGT